MDLIYSWMMSLVINQPVGIEVINPDFIVRILEDLEVSNAVLYFEFVKIQVKMFFM
jgi:hypothetical protein